MIGGSVRPCSTERVRSAGEENGWTPTHYHHPLLAEALSSASPKFPGIASQRPMVKCRRQLQEMLQLKANTRLHFIPGFSVLPQKKAGIAWMISSMTEDRANETLVLHRWCSEPRFRSLLFKLVKQKTFKDPSVKANGFVIREVTN